MQDAFRKLQPMTTIMMDPAAFFNGLTEAVLDRVFPRGCNTRGYIVERLGRNRPGLRVCQDDVDVTIIRTAADPGEWLIPRYRASDGFDWHAGIHTGGYSQ